MKPGDRVWFISKFDDYVSGVYEGEDTIPWGDGEKRVALIRSDNAFGHDSAVKGVLCAVPPGDVRQGEAP